MQVGPQGGFTLPSLATNPVYAIVPGIQPGHAPSGGERGASTPVAGQRVTLTQGVPGLPAGTYTLLPSTYALLPGAFRVEINGGARAPSARIEPSPCATGPGARPAPCRCRTRAWLTRCRAS